LIHEKNRARKSHARVPLRNREERSTQYFPKKKPENFFSSIGHMGTKKGRIVW